MIHGTSKQNAIWRICSPESSKTLTSLIGPINISISQLHLQNDQKKTINHANIKKSQHEEDTVSKKLGMVGHIYNNQKAETEELPCVLGQPRVQIETL